jgi:small-conductance mechanosensitive channel
MSFWQQLQSTSGLRETFLWVLLLFIIAGVILSIIRPAERLRIRNASLLLGLSLIGMLGAAALLAYGVNPTDSLFKWVRWAARFFQWLALLNIASVLVFEVLLDAMRLRPPRIIRDLVLALGYIVIGLTILSKDVDITGIIATSAVITAVIGLSFQDTLGNVMGGMAAVGARDCHGRLDQD